jgi:hypothetical protein
MIWALLSLCRCRKPVLFSEVAYLQHAEANSTVDGETLLKVVYDNTIRQKGCRQEMVLLFGSSWLKVMLCLDKDKLNPSQSVWSGNELFCTSFNTYGLKGISMFPNKP